MHRRDHAVSENDNWAATLAEMLRRIGVLERVAGGGQGGTTTGAFNGIINGAMVVAQRGTDFDLAAGVPAYTIDRWQGSRSAAGGFVTQVSPTTGQFQYALQFGRDPGNTSTAGIWIGQSLESLDSYRYRGQRCTLSFYASRGANLSSDNQAMSVQVSSGTGVDENHLGGVTGRAYPLYTTVPLTEVLTRYSFSFDVPANITELGVMMFIAPTGTAGANDWVAITGVQLEVGPAATPFQFTDQATERTRCRRFFRRLGGAQPYTTFGLGFTANSATLSKVHVELGVPMRVVPAVVVSGSTQVHGTNNVDGTVSAVSVQLNQCSRDRLVIDLTHGSITDAQQAVSWRANNSNAGLIDFSAEL